MVCLAAIAAIDKGRRTLTRLHLDQQRPAQQFSLGRVVLWLVAFPALPVSIASATILLLAASAGGGAITPSPTDAATFISSVRASATPMLQAKIAATEAFWLYLEDFKRVFNADPPERWPNLPQSHPFMYTTTVPAGSGAAPRRVLHIHPHTTSPPPAAADTLPPVLI